MPSRPRPFSNEVREKLHLRTMAYQQIRYLYNINVLIVRSLYNFKCMFCITTASELHTQTVQPLPNSVAIAVMGNTA